MRTTICMLSWVFLTIAIAKLSTVTEFPSFLKLPVTLSMTLCLLQDFKELFN